MQNVQFPAIFADIFKPARYKLIHGGRGSGKSHSVASLLVITGAQRPIRFLCCREIQKSLAASVHQILQDKIVAHGLQYHYTITREGIKGANGTHFLFAGLRSNPDSIKSMEGLDGAWVEEAQTVSQVSLDLLLPTLRKPGSEVIFTLNRRSTEDPIDRMFFGGKPPPNSIIIKANWNQNPFFPDVLRNEMLWLKERDVDKWRHIWEGEPLKLSQARVFKNWNIDDLDREIPNKAKCLFGADWGFSIDPTVLVKAWRWNRTLYIADEAYKIGCEIDETPSLFAGSDIRVPARWDNVHNHAGIEGSMRNTIIADGARPETISYLAKRGFMMKKAIKGARSVEEGVEFVSSLDIVVHPRCKHTIDELESYSYKIDSHTDEILPILEDGNNHVIDALRYAVEAERRAARRKNTAMVVSTVELKN